MHIHVLHFEENLMCVVCVCVGVGVGVGVCVCGVGCVGGWVSFVTMVYSDMN